MKLKNLWGLLAVLFVAVFALAACSSDDDDDKTGTYEYQVINSFDGSIESINKVDDAFKQAFGAESSPFTLTGTKSECNRKAKEYAMKAQAALAGDGSFSADVKLINATTDELIYSFDIQKDENAVQASTLHYELNENGITLFNAKGNRVKIEKKLKMYDTSWGYDNVVNTDKELIILGGQYKTKASVRYEFTMWEGTKGKELCRFEFTFSRKYAAEDVTLN